MSFEIDRGVPSTFVSSGYRFRRPIAIPGYRLAGLGTVTIQRALDVKEQQLNTAFNLLARLGNSSATAASIRDYQLGWNTRWRDLQEIIVALGHPTIANSLRELATDGVWGANTAYTTALWLSSSPAPSRQALVPAWWRTNGAAITVERDRHLRSIRDERARLATGDTSAPEPDPEPTTTTPPSPMPTPTPMPSPSPTPGPTRNGSLRTEGEAAAGGALLLGVGLVGIGLMMKMGASKKRGRLGGWSGRRRRR